MGAALRRRALDQRQPIRGEDGDGRTVAGDGRRIGRVAVEQVPASLGAADRGHQRALDPVLAANRRLGAGERRAERDQVAAVAGAEGAPGEGEVERLEEVRLAGAVGADQADDPGVQLEPQPLEAAQRSGLGCGDQHGAPHTLRRIGITR